MTGAFLTFLIVVPAGMLCLLPMKNQLRFSLLRTLAGLTVLSVLLSLGAACLAVRFSFKPNNLLFPMVCLLFAAYHLCLTVSLSKSLAVFFSIMALEGILGIFSACFDAYRNPALGADSYTMEYALFHLALSFAAILLFSYPLAHFGSRLIDSLNLDSVWYWTIPFSVLLLGASLFLRPEKYETLHVNRVGEVIPQILSVLLVLWCLIHVIYYVIVMGILNAAKTEEEKRLLEMQEIQFLSQQRYMDESARVRHDFRQNIRILLELYEAGDIESVGSYLQGWAEELPQNTILQYCPNNVLNALLNYYAGVARSQKTDFQVEIELPDQLRIKDPDLCGMIGNLLENALNACRELDDGWVQLSARALHGSVFYLIATNPYKGRIKENDGRIVSSKKEGSGIGLSSIRSTVEKYGGSASFSYEEQLFTADIQIPL